MDKHEIPESIVIWLHYDPADFAEFGLTWCEDQLSDDDIPFIKASVVKTLLLDWLERRKLGFDGLALRTVRLLERIP